MPTVPKKVHIPEIDRTFPSARVAAKEINGDYSAIYRCLRGDRGTHKGYTFEYEEDERG